MAIPAGILTATITFGKTFDVFGANASVSVKVTPSNRLLWVATGDYLANFEAISTAEAGVVGQFLLPRDQPGFRDAAGAEIRGWYYVAYITETLNGQSTQYRKVFTVGEGQSLIDLDTLPVDAVVMPPGSAPTPAVTSVNGEAGDVTVEGATSESIAAAIIEDGPAKDALTEQIDAVVGPSAAEQMSNPETPLNSATVTVVEGVLGGGVAGMIRVVDARGNLSVARPAWAGIILWWVEEGDPNPVNFATGDSLQEVAVEELPWTPALLPNKMVWLDAQALALANGAAVASWTDLSGDARHAVQATSGHQPVFATNKINGHPAVVADGVDDELLVTLAADYGGAFTVYTVAGTDLADNTAGADYLWDVAEPPPSTVIGRGSLYRGTTETYNLQRGTTLSSAAAAWTTGPKLLKAVANGAASSVTVDGVVVASGSLSSSAIARVIHLFSRATPTAGNYFAGYIGEYLFVSGMPTTENDIRVLAYLENRWGL